MSVKVDYLVPGINGIDRIVKKAYWDMVFEDMSKHDDYELLLQNLSDLKEMIKKIIPSRTDLHIKNLDEYLDIPFIKQKFEFKVFGYDDFLALINYLVDWLKKLSAVADIEEIKLFQKTIIKVAEDKGYLYVLPYAFDAIYTQLDKVLQVTESIREKLKS